MDRFLAKGADGRSVLVNLHHHALCGILEEHAHSKEGSKGVRESINMLLTDVYMEFLNRGWKGRERLWQQLVTTIIDKEGGVPIKVIADGHEDDVKYTCLPSHSATELFHTLIDLQLQYPDSDLIVLVEPNSYFLNTSRTIRSEWANPVGDGPHPRDDPRNMSLDMTDEQVALFLSNTHIDLSHLRISPIERGSGPSHSRTRTTTPYNLEKALSGGTEGSPPEGPVDTKKDNLSTLSASTIHTDEETQIAGHDIVST
jgi:hypothetical protein